jgi:hypothetical protein
MVRRHKRAIPEDLGRRIGEARALYDRGIHDRAEAQIRVLLPECDATLGERHPESIALRNLLGSVLFQQRRLRESAQLHEQAMHLGIRVFGRNDPRTLSYAHNFGTALLGGLASEGIDLLEDTLRRRTRKLGRFDEETLATANALGAALFAAGAVDRGIELLRQAYDDSARLGTGHPVHQGIAKNLQMALRNSGWR